MTPKMPEEVVGQGIEITHLDVEDEDDAEDAWVGGGAFIWVVLRVVQGDGRECFGGGREGEVGGWVVRNDWARLLKNEGQLVALNEPGNKQSCVRVRSSSIAITGTSAGIHN